MKDGIKNARFWDFLNGAWVKITLKPHQSIATWKSAQTDEGFAFEATTYHHDGQSIRREWIERGRDCDGWYERGGETVCPLDALTARDVYADWAEDTNRGILAPVWEWTKNHQRDHAAEAARY